MRLASLGLTAALLVGCGGDGDMDVDGGDGCGPSPCGACEPGFEANDRCVDGEWVCECRDVRDAGSDDDAGALDAGAMDAGDADGGAEDAGASDGGSDAGVTDAGTDAGVVDAGPNTCTLDSDCPVDEWCRARMSSGRECVPYQLDGDPCGGFVPPWLATRCGPGLSCVAGNPLIADAPGICAVEVTVADLTSMPGRYDMRTVGVLTGWVLGGPAGCTRIACPPTMPCCNTCNSTELLADTMGAMSGVSLRDMGGAPYTCTGDECMPYSSCTQPVDMRYRVIGQYFSSMGGYIEVQSISPVL